MDRTTIPPVLPRVPGLPLLGNALALKPAQMPTQLEIWARVYGPIYTFRLLHRRGICVSDTDVGLWALKQRPDRFRRPKRMELVARQLETHGLFTAEGEDWHRQRTLMRPAFSRRAFEQTFGHIPVVTERLMRRWSSLGSVPIEARQELMRFTADVTTLLAFGQDLNSVEEPSALQRQIEEIFAALSRRVLAPLPYLWMLPLPQERSADRAAGHVRDRVLDVVRRGSRDGRTLLDAMLEARKSERFSDREVYANVFTLLLAGEDTTANSLAWMVYMLARQPELQARLRAEAKEVLGDAPIARTLEQAMELKLTQMAFKEVLRLRGPALMIFLEPTQETDLRGIPVSPDDLVVVLTRVMAEREENFTQAHRLIPERWDPEWRASRPGWKHRHQAFLPFGGGARTCPGAQLAALEAQVIISAMCKRFAIELVGTPDVRETFSFVMHPTPFQIRLRPLT